jgi:hypothetical protein
MLVIIIALPVHADQPFNRIGHWPLSINHFDARIGTTLGEGINCKFSVVATGSNLFING